MPYDPLSALDGAISGVPLANGLPAMLAELEKIQGATINSALSALAGGELTPEKAFEAFVVLQTQRRLAQKLTQAARMAESQRAKAIPQALKTAVYRDERGNNH